VAAVPGPLEAALRRPNALNFSVLGFLVGNLRLTDERRLARKHDVYVEGILAPNVLSHFSFVAGGGSAGYPRGTRRSEPKTCSRGFPLARTAPLARLCLLSAGFGHQEARRARK
jgi:hypothetical protein